MQTVSSHLIEKLIKEGHSEKEIHMYFEGLSQSFNTLLTSLNNSKMEVKENETDPLYIYTWNDVIDKMTDLIKEILNNTFSNSNKEMGENPE